MKDGVRNPVDVLLASRDHEVFGEGEGEREEREREEKGKKWVIHTILPREMFAFCKKNIAEKVIKTPLLIF